MTPPSDDIDRILVTISYEEMKLFYDEAETLFGVAPSKSLHPQNKVVQEFLLTMSLRIFGVA